MESEVVKMIVGPLHIFDGCVAAWHWPWSVTWRWIFDINKHRANKKGFYSLRTHCKRGVLCGLNTRWIDVSFRSQPNMRRNPLLEQRIDELERRIAHLEGFLNESAQ